MESLTLGQREAVNNVILRSQDRPGERWYCFHYPAGLPWDTEGQLAHRCGEPETGDVVWYHGTLREMHGAWEVTQAEGGRLRLFDVDRALSNVRPASVTVLRKRDARGKAA